MLSKGTLSSCVGPTLRPLLSQHSSSDPVRREQNPTFSPAVSSWTVPLQVVKPVPAGSVKRIRLFASSESAPVDDAEKRTTYRVVADGVSEDAATDSPVSGWAVTTVTGLGWGVGSLVVESSRVPFAPGFVTPSNVIVAVVEAGIV